MSSLCLKLRELHFNTRKNIKRLLFVSHWHSPTQHLQTNKTVPVHSDCKRTSCATIPVNYLQELQRALCHKCRKLSEGLISRTKLRNWLAQRGDGWGQSSERRDGKNTLEKAVKGAAKSDGSSWSFSYFFSFFFFIPLQHTEKILVHFLRMFWYVCFNL